MQRPMRVALGLVILGSVLGGAGRADAPDQRRWTFERATVGEPPPHLRVESGTWVVFDDGGNKVVAQTASNADEVFNVALIDGTEAKDVTLTVKFKAVAGAFDQGGGLIWRAKDEDHYYIARYNPIEGNLRVYKVVGGRRTLLQSEDIAKSDGWHTLRVTMKAAHIRCQYDGREALDVHDGTITEAGRIGLWTKADARTYFDDLTLDVD